MIEDTKTTGTHPSYISTFHHTRRYACKLRSQRNQRKIDMARLKFNRANAFAREVHKRYKFTVAQIKMCGFMPNSFRILVFSC